MADFEISYKRLEKWEGGYANIIGDKGGETYKGISRVNHPTNDIFKKIDEIKNAGITDKKAIDKELESKVGVAFLVREFYKNEYWDKLKLDDISNQNFACNIFMLGVNAGIKRAIKVGQEACSVLVDGVLGNQSIIAFKKAGYKETENFTTIEIKYYESIVKRDETQRKFLNGWIKRAKEI